MPPQPSKQPTASWASMLEKTESSEHVLLTTLTTSATRHVQAPSPSPHRAPLNVEYHSPPVFFQTLPDQQPQGSATYLSHVQSP
mgnify:CR=1 FL=1